MKKGFVKALIFITACITLAFLSAFISYTALSGDGGPSQENVKVHNNIKEEDNQISNQPVTPTEDEIINFVIAGVEKNQTDIIIFASYNLDKNKVDVFTLPRDTHYRLKGGNHSNIDKLKDVYGSAQIAGLKGAVADLLENVKIDHHIVVDYKGFESIIDSIGGVTVTIKEPMRYEDPYQALVIDFKPGTHKLNGRDSLKYIRYIKGNEGDVYSRGDDVGRLKEIQSFMKEAINQSFSYKLPVVFTTAIRHVDTSLSVSEIAKLSTAVATMTKESIHSHILPGYMTQEGYYVIHQGKLQELIKDIYLVSEEN
ncbi:LCP family protein [Alkaliphilus serpentinus]|uniref:Cell envelope-related transcriptional attenuator domain-containing protein n=1 Tax=Alkaliphilus serpentinus TaxID=1482731 RepID=A0A833M7U9_9FIRM|nr:LCP family protein [Alkaliphilus serpentinus]KAB3529271.1 hypothetical protein F8153_09695 [Alkaliphilus serpentinus]